MRRFGVLVIVALFGAVVQSAVTAAPRPAPPKDAILAQALEPVRIRNAQQDVQPIRVRTAQQTLEDQFSPAAAAELERFYRYCDPAGEDSDAERCAPMATAAPAAPVGGPPGQAPAPEIKVFTLCARGEDTAAHVGCPSEPSGTAWTRRDLGVYQKCLAVSQAAGVQPAACQDAGVPPLPPPENLAVFRSAADPANLVLTGSVKRPPEAPGTPVPQLYDYPWFFRFDIDIDTDWVPDLSFPIAFRELSLAEGATCLASNSRFCLFTGSGILAVDFRDHFTPIRGCGKDGAAYAIYDTTKDHMDLYLELPIECVAPKSGAAIGVWGTQVFEASVAGDAADTQRLGAQISRLATPLEQPLALTADESAGVVTAAPYLIPLSRTQGFIAQGDWSRPETAVAAVEESEEPETEPDTIVVAAPAEDTGGLFGILPNHWLVAGIEGAGRWQSLPTARLGTANLATAAPGFDLNEDSDLTRYGGGIFIGIQPWLEDPGVVPTGWSVSLHLAYEDGNADADRTVLAAAGTAPAIVGLAGNAAVGLGATTRFDREIDLDSWTAGGEIGRTFGLGGGIALTPFVKLDGSWTDIETRTTITSTSPGVVNNVLREDIDEDSLRLLLGAEATAPLTDNLFVRVGGAIGPGYTAVDYDGRDCGDGNPGAGTCNGAVFLNRVARDERFVGLAGAGRLGLVWYVPWNGRHPFALSLDGSVATRPGVAVDYPQAAGAGQSVDLRADQLVAYSIGAKIIIPYGR